jgi:hypothetical protein
MAHTFAVDIPKGMTTSSGVAKVKEGIELSGGTYSFDDKTNRGEFSFRGVVGSFIITGTSVIISIIKKPFIVTNGFIEEKIRELFANP